MAFCGLLFPSPRLAAEEPSPPVLAHAVELFPEVDLQRSIGTDVYLRAVYDLLFLGHFRGTAGVSLSFTPFAINGYFIDLGYENIAGTGLGCHIKLLSDEYPEYGRAANTVIPYLRFLRPLLDAVRLFEQSGRVLRREFRRHHGVCRKPLRHRRALERFL
jgi:hypothetical protein